MDYIFLVVGSIIIITCFYFIIAPFFNGSKRVDLSDKNDEQETSLEMIYATVNEIEMDYLMKKISLEDFEAMKMKYNHLAASLLKAEDHSSAVHQKKVNEQSKELDDEILKELEALRNQKGRS